MFDIQLIYNLISDKMYYKIKYIRSINFKNFEFN